MISLLGGLLGFFFSPTVLSVVLILVSLFLKKFARPHVGYFVLKKIAGYNRTRFFLRNYEPIPVGELIVSVTAAAEIQEIRVAAGPWYSSCEKKDGGYALLFNGLPSEGIVSIEVSIADIYVDPHITVAHESPVKPRDFRPIPRWSLGRQLYAYFSRWFFGAGLSVWIYWIVRRVGAGSMTDELPWFFPMLLFLASMVVFVGAVSTPNKELICGYLGEKISLSLKKQKSQSA